mmetsp:Transcript_6371/g.11089  ORF Transcript_6371/g.11089 Transcript_6371/m.11089 type:complete len:198 (-) Transcript_6371:96-689(-)|eukprot:CAMPEP_0204905928 /NCGR_PEP_ID=MMETSP1397-20131031/5700_1 /ASSEMBLY_ACC=CAM_ASM_000891 /TAXON_ID=49980 /ORGANISM="Climacostomum Climacostomum virens, Strain Stock W-24" /LENGTH=197 /DNA_ID=CAMNT_0052074881 /DNA_START=970 /DNA_END=1563 /DNA_ORIENTATION=-
MSRRVILEAFCFRQFDDAKTSQFIPFPKQEFEDKINELYKPELLKPGYAEFCKHLIVPNFTEARQSTLEITEANAGLLRSGYEARRAEELPVLVRWFPKELVGEPPVAAFLDVILYSKEQIDKENAAMGASSSDTRDFDWGIISVKPQAEDFELPMTPITVMRNALPLRHGGSGRDIDDAEYRRSAEYWQTHALVKA